MRDGRGTHAENAKEGVILGIDFAEEAYLNLILRGNKWDFSALWVMREKREPENRIGH